MLEKVGLSPIRVAYLLSISRQAVYEGLKKEKHYLDGVRVARIADALVHHQDPKDAGVAASLESAFQTLSGEEGSWTPQAPRRAGFSTLMDHDYRLVFARNPTEVSDPRYLDTLMQSGLLSKMRLLAYFLTDQETARLLWQVIQQLLARHTQRYPSRVVIFETNLARALPDITLTRTPLGDWEGQTQSVETPSHGVGYLVPEYVARLKLLLDAAGFATNPTDSPIAFVPHAKTSHYDGFTFVRLFDTLTMDSKAVMETA